MRRQRKNATNYWQTALCLCLVLGSSAEAQNTIFFSVNDPGVVKSVPVWGVDTAWPNFDNVRQSVEHIGQSRVGAVRIPVYIDEPLVEVVRDEFGLSNAAMAKIDAHLALAAMAGPNVPVTFGLSGSDPASIDPMYVSGGGINVANYALNIKLTQEYINSRPGFQSSTVYAIEPFNEPDFNFPNANPADLNSIIGQLKTYPVFQNTLMMAPSTLNSDVAQGWYDQVPQATAGSSHLLAGSLTSWTNFIEHVNADGNPFINPEIHSMGEILAGAEHGMQMGMVWADVLRGRGTAIRASDGKRLGYYEDLVHQSAGAVYRAPDGNIYAFAGGLERDYTGSQSAYRFVSTDQDVYFNGIKVPEFMLHTKPDTFISETDNDFQNYGSASSEGSFADIDLDASGIPALDGYRWKIVNVGDGSVMEVAGGGTADGVTIQSAADNGGLNQLWKIVRTRNGYYQLYNANSGRTAEVIGYSLANGANVQQFGTADHSGQQWFIDEAGGGSLYLRNGHSNKYLDADANSTNIIQWEGNGGANQKWQFVLANPTVGPTSHFEFKGNLNNSAGGNSSQAFGGPVYDSGPTGVANNALRFDGVNDYVQLPSGAVSSEDITIAAWVKWDGGGAWQRIFDFGDDTNTYMFLTPSSDENLMHFGITTGSDAGEYILETEALPVGEWAHVTLTLGGNTGILYVNGTPRVAGQILLDPTDISPSFSYIGESLWPQDPTLNGSIADFRIYNYALHPTQVLSLAQFFETGDFNSDGLVGAADYTVWRNNLGSNGIAPFSPGDGNGDGAVTTADYDVWRNHYGESGQSAQSLAVPEPSTIVMLIALVLTGAALWRAYSRWFVLSL
jgi:hypothetical protein